MNLQTHMLYADDEQLTCEVELRDRNVIILHGAGQANRQRYYTFAKELLDRGVGVVLFDFSGHGDSSGLLSELSLARRVRQAQAVIDHFMGKNRRFYLVGFSMSGQTVCDLLPLYGDRVEAILLGCPGIYADKVRSLAFGDPEFTAMIRRPNSWQESMAPRSLSDFAGKTVLVIGEDDTVIPTGVIALLKAAAKQFTYHDYPGVSHQLAKWLSEHPVELRRLFDELL